MSKSRWVPKSASQWFCFHKIYHFVLALPQATSDGIDKAINIVEGRIKTVRGIFRRIPTYFARPKPDKKNTHRLSFDTLDRLPRLNVKWQPILQGPFEVGIGVHTGSARVGNIGSEIKFKYGALGNTVNIASRVQGATKHLKVPLLITDRTQAGLEDNFHTRCLGPVRVVNIDEPVTLFELTAPGTKSWAGLKRGYEQALQEFTEGKFLQACSTIGQFLSEHPDDGPSSILLARVADCLIKKPVPFDPVMVLPSK